MLVYLLKNELNGKTYVGQHTGFRLEQRWNKHLSSRTNGHLAASNLKYGPDNFTRTILCYASCREELNLLEQFFIAFFHSADRRYGYNKTLGGQPAQRFTKEIREVLSTRMREVWRRRRRIGHRKHAEAVKRWWRGLSGGERRLIKLRQSLGRSGQTITGHTPWNKGKRGLPSGRKGRKFGPQKNPCRHYKPFTEEHKRRISRALRRYHRQRRKKNKED